MVEKYMIALVDNKYYYPPVFLAKFDEGFGTTPNREEAFVVSESEADKYLDIAQQMANKMMEAACLPVADARQAIKWEYR